MFLVRLYRRLRRTLDDRWRFPNMEVNGVPPGELVPLLDGIGRDRRAHAAGSDSRRRRAGVLVLHHRQGYFLSWIVTGERSSNARTVSAGISAASPRIAAPAPPPTSAPMAAPVRHQRSRRPPRRRPRRSPPSWRPWTLLDPASWPTGDVTISIFRPSPIVRLVSSTGRVGLALQPPALVGLHDAAVDPGAGGRHHPIARPRSALRESRRTHRRSSSFSSKARGWFESRAPDLQPSGRPWASAGPAEAPARALVRALARARGAGPPAGRWPLATRSAPAARAAPAALPQAPLRLKRPVAETLARRRRPPRGPSLRSPTDWTSLACASCRLHGITSTIRRATYRLALSTINAARRLRASVAGCDVSYLSRSSP